MNNIAAIIKSFGETKDANEANRLMETALRMYKEKKDVIQAIYYEENKN